MRLRRRVRLLRQQAPTWLAQMPALLSLTERERLQREVLGATQERMLREMAEAVEVLTAQKPLVLVVEDLQWSDVSTLELLAALARRQEQARLLVVATYRPVEVLGSGHPLNSVTRELLAHGLCTELALGLLTEADIAAYLRARFPESVLPTQLVRVLHERTEGNPLFMVNVVDYLVAQDGLVEVGGRWTLRAAVEAVADGVPGSLQQLIEQQFERLSPAEQQVLEVASVAGTEFAAATVAAGVEADVEEVEARCAELARHAQFLQAKGVSTWPDGTVAACYSFSHALYQNVLYERVTPGRCQRLHQQIGEREEGAYGSRAGEIAAELAVHFERGRDYRRAQCSIGSKQP